MAVPVIVPVVVTMAVPVVDFTGRAMIVPVVVFMAVTMIVFMAMAMASLVGGALSESVAVNTHRLAID